MTHQKAVPGRSIHHINCKSKGGSNDKSNLIELKHKTHVSIHQLFDTQNLGEKIKTLMGIEWIALRDDVKLKLLECLNGIGTDNRDWYKPTTFK